MNEQALKARREYKRKWNREHPDKVKEYNARYWEKRAQNMDDQTKEQAKEE